MTQRFLSSSRQRWAPSANSLIARKWLQTVGTLTQAAALSKLLLEATSAFSDAVMTGLEVGESITVSICFLNLNEEDPDQLYSVGSQVGGVMMPLGRSAGGFEASRALVVPRGASKQHGAILHGAYKKGASTRDSSIPCDVGIPSRMPAIEPMPATPVAVSPRARCAFHECQDLRGSPEDHGPFDRSQIKASTQTPSGLAAILMMLSNPGPAKKPGLQPRTTTTSLTIHLPLHSPLHARGCYGHDRRWARIFCPSDGVL